jgi:hypothetical protein
MRLACSKQVASVDESLASLPVYYMVDRSSEAAILVGKSWELKLSTITHARIARKSALSKRLSSVKI